GLAVDVSRRVTGPVLGPADDGYDDARAVHNGLVDRRPAVIVRAQTTQDVVATLALARRAGLEVSVRGGGHNVARRPGTGGGGRVRGTPSRRPCRPAAACSGRSSTTRPPTTGWRSPEAPSRPPASPATPWAAASAG